MARAMTGTRRRSAATGAEPQSKDCSYHDGTDGAMTAHHPPGCSDWIYRLAPRPGAQAPHTPASSARSIAEAASRLNSGPVAWAVQAGADLACLIIEEVPELGGGRKPFETLRIATEAAILHALLLLADPSVDQPVPEDSLLGDREFARRRIALDKMLRGCRIAHAALTRALMAACRDLVRPEELAEQLLRITETLFGHMDVFSSYMTAEYLVEHDRWTTSGAAVREETVRRILAGQPVEQERAGQVLNHPLDGPQLAVIAWCDTARAEAMQAATAELIRRHDSSSTLVVPIGETTVWAWGRLRGAPPASRVSEPTFPTDVRFARGSVRDGLSGFRQSHEDAQHAARVGQLNPHGTGRLVDHRDVALAALLSTDMPALRRFVSDELGALATDSPWTEQLRETVRLYLRSERSLMTVAAQLHVARNTVTYRVKRAREVLGHDLAARLPETMTALEAARVLGSAVLRRGSG